MDASGVQTRITTLIAFAVVISSRIDATVQAIRALNASVYTVTSWNNNRPSNIPVYYYNVFSTYSQVGIRGR